MGLWNSNQGSRIWETDVGDGNGSCHVVGIAWSPNGQSIAVLQDPPAISLHSLQDGRVTTSSSSITLPVSESPLHLMNVWWFRDERNAPVASSIPDIFKRKQTITGSAHSVLKLLPLLDNIQEETEKSTATDLFAFQGSYIRSSHKTQLPPVIDSWPSLSTDLAAASISSSSHNKPSLESANMDEMDSSNVNSLLMINDDHGRLFCHLDGTFSLGFVPIGTDVILKSMVKHPLQPIFVGQPSIVRGNSSEICLTPTVIHMPLLTQRNARDLAALTSTARELMWYAIRVITEMQGIWNGTESNTGARDFGPKWISLLETKQKEQFGQETPTPILDLTTLLTTGRPTESLLDFLGSGEQMSERGIQKWESTVSEALVKLRDSAEKRASPAFQRLHIVLTELQGWAKLPHFSVFEISQEEVALCLDSVSRAIVLSSWLASVSRMELYRFREFISWLRFEVSNVNSPNDGNIPRHDLLEVNNYFISGLPSSSIDKWFSGPIPQFQPSDLGVPNQEKRPLADQLKRAHIVATDASQMAWQTTSSVTDHSHLDKNMVALIQDLAHRSQRIFHHAAEAASRSAVVSFDSLLKRERVPENRVSPDGSQTFPFRERAVLNENGELLQHLVGRMQPDTNTSNILLLTQLHFGVEVSELPSEIGMVLLECYLLEEGEERSDFDLLEADFFDDECVVILYRLRQREKQTFLATLNYNTIGYQKLLDEGYVKRSAHEDLMQDALELWKNGKLTPTKIPINRRRALSGCRHGKVSLALNGRAGRRVACIMDSTGTTLESFDLEGDAEDMEVADDARGG